MKRRGVAILVGQMMLISLLFGIVWAQPDVRFDSPTYLVVKQASLLDPSSWNGTGTMGCPFF